MEYAINKLTNKIESADQATGHSSYICPCCGAMMSFRAGAVRKKYFAHWPGLVTAACENYVPGQPGNNADGSVLKTRTKRSMELRLIVPKQGNRAGWFLELLIPSWRASDATVTVDVGGRFRQFDMRRSDTGARAMAEPSMAPYRITSFEGQPDPLFRDGVEPECLGLPADGAAVFTTSGRGGNPGFARARELQCAGTYALLWHESVAADLPDELVIDWLTGRQAWRIALVTLPEIPSETCVQWLQTFTGLSVNARVPYIVQVWPFLSRNSSINTVEYAESSVVLLAAHSIPMGQTGSGPLLLAHTGLDRISAVGLSRSPALFELKPERIDTFRIGKSDHQDFERIFSCASSLRRHHRPPSVQAVFSDQSGAREVVGLHRKRCIELIAFARAGGLSLDYLALPPGAKGRLLTHAFSGVSIMPLSAGTDAAPHNPQQRLLPKSTQSSVITVLMDSRSHFDLDFLGFGRIRLKGSDAPCIAGLSPSELGPKLRSRMHSFMYQLQISTPVSAATNDAQLVRAFFTTTPKPELVPHYRALAKKILDCGYHFNSGRPLA